jgi:alpha-beta hydrolase superfamily lysophospholipase
MSHVDVTEPEGRVGAATNGSTRGGQTWILDQLIRMSGTEDVLHPGIMGVRLERGFKFGDMQRVFDRVGSARAYPRAWEQEAARQEALAVEAEANGRTITAAQHRHRAALYYGRAQHLTPGRDSRRVPRYEGLRRNYRALIGHLGGRVTHHAIKLGNGQKAYALFHRAAGSGPHPTILYVPGMDAAKEDYPNPFLNDFAARGMNVIAMDGPGQGESLAEGVTIDLENYQEAVTRVLDTFLGFPEVDKERVGCFGTSMGTYWSVLAAAQEPRIRALAGQMPNVGTKNVIFNEAQPNFRRIYMHMSGIASDVEFDELIPQMDSALQRAASGLRVPYLLVGGDLDELTPLDHMHAWFDQLSCPRELWVYRDSYHPMGEVVADAYPAIADWLLDALNGRIPQDLDRRIEIDPHEVPPQSVVVR